MIKIKTTEGRRETERNNAAKLRRREEEVDKAQGEGQGRGKGETLCPCLLSNTAQHNSIWMHQLILLFSYMNISTEALNLMGMCARKYYAQKQHKSMTCRENATLINRIPPSLSPHPVPRMPTLGPFQPSKQFS